jgi:hypothetical protein
MLMTGDTPATCAYQVAIPSGGQGGHGAFANDQRGARGLAEETVRGIG